MSIFARQINPQKLRAGMRAAGRKVAQEHLGSLKAITREQRIDAALGVLKELGGAATFRERMENILSIIRGPIPSCRFEIKKSPR